MKIIRTGYSRIVITTKRYAIKIPNLYNWRTFLRGLIANLDECRWSKKTTDNRHCPVLFYFPGGFLSIMPKCKVLTDDEWFENEEYIMKTFFPLPENIEVDENYNGLYNMSCEKKADSFGWLNGKIVVIDYAD